MCKEKGQPSFFDLDDYTTWKKEWQDMPEFIQEDLTPFQSLIVHFETEEDRKEFAKLVDQFLSKDTKSIWFPKSIPMNLKNKTCEDAT